MIDQNDKSTMISISHLAYELYQLDWKLSHGITLEREKRELLRYFNENIIEDQDNISYSEYLDSYGYGGMYYVCYEEFLQTEYLDRDYIERLLDHDEVLIDLYLQDIQMR